MEETPVISAPAGFVPLHAVGWSGSAGECHAVAADSPLPVSIARSGPAAVLAGTAPSSRTVGPFAAATGRVAYLTLSGTWTGSVRVLRSVDGGASKHPLTLGGQEWGRFTGNVCEAIWEESEAGASLWLECQLSGGVLAYRVAQ